MIREQRWKAKWQAYMDFMRENHRRPSKYRAEEMVLVNWAKHCRKLRNRGDMPPERMKLFEQLVAAAEECHRVNQYLYASGERVPRPPKKEKAENADEETPEKEEQMGAAD